MERGGAVGAIVRRAGSLRLCWGARGGVAYRGQAWQSQIDGGGDDQGADPEIGADESSSLGEGGASFPCPEKHLPPSKNAVSGVGEKHRPASPSLRPCQPLPGTRLRLVRSKPNRESPRSPAQ